MGEAEKKINGKREHSIINSGIELQQQTWFERPKVETRSVKGGKLSYEKSVKGK